MAKMKEKQLLNLVLSLPGRRYTRQHHSQTQAGRGDWGLQADRKSRVGLALPPGVGPPEAVAPPRCQGPRSPLSPSSHRLPREDDPWR